jgi:hypothetical protein
MLTKEARTKALETEIWEAVMGCAGGSEPWYQAIYADTDWETPGTLTVWVDDPNGEEGKDVLKRRFTAKRLLRIYQSMLAEERQHCGGCDIVGSPDSCTLDVLIQYAIFGEQVYA